MPVAPIINNPTPICAISCEIFFNGTFLNFSFGFSEIKFLSSNKELVIIKAENIKKIIDIIGPR